MKGVNRLRQVLGLPTLHPLVLPPGLSAPVQCLLGQGVRMIAFACRPAQFVNWVSQVLCFTHCSQTILVRDLGWSEFVIWQPKLAL